VNGIDNVKSCAAVRCSPQLSLALNMSCTILALSVRHDEKVGPVQAFDDDADSFLTAAIPDAKLRASASGVNDVRLHPAHGSLVAMNDATTGARPAPFANVAQLIETSSACTHVAAVGVPESLQTMRSDLRVASLNVAAARLPARVRLLVRALADAHQQGLAGNLKIRHDLQPLRLVIGFARNGAQARVCRAVLPSLCDAARAANRIYLHAYTDEYVASRESTELAIRRAIAVRDLLTKRKVDPLRVRLFYRGVGSYLANNSTEAGRGVNRRVEIEFRQL
jgi:outer membrane protein OmpA-like peptidoglycan-associated protein